MKIILVLLYLYLLFAPIIGWIPEDKANIAWLTYVGYVGFLIYDEVTKR